MIENCVVFCGTYTCRLAIFKPYILETLTSDIKNKFSKADPFPGSIMLLNMFSFPVFIALLESFTSHGSIALANHSLFVVL